MKRSIIVILTILAVLCVAVALVACGHQHNYQWVEEVEATCGREGTVGHYHCADCGKNFDKDYKEIDNVTLKKLSQHTWVAGDEVAATCETDGYVPHTCSVCGATGAKTVTVKAFGHDYNTGVITVQPTCFVAGERVQTCRTCGKTQTVEVDKLEHALKLVPAVEPTCEQPGSGAGQRCSVCGYVVPIDNAIAPLGHSYGDWQTLIAATDDHAGLEIRTCDRCGKAETQDVAQKEHVFGAWVDNIDGTHTRTCQNTDCENKVDTQPCVYDYGVVNAATCTQDGYTLYTCQICNHQLQGEHTDALGHSYGDYVADFVGLENVDNHIHTHTRVCKRCNATDTADCTYSGQEVIAPTCTAGGYTKQICNVCSSVHETNPIEALGHKFGQWSYDETVGNTHKQRCETCLTEVEQACVYVDEVTLPNCTDGGYTTHTCSICQHIYTDGEVESLGHTFSDWKYNADGDKDTHSHTCSRCLLVETNDCEMVEIAEAETCTTDGSVTRTCKHCLISITEEGAKSLGHNFNDFADSGNGNHTRSCQRCGASDSQAHAYENTVVSEADCDNARVDKYTCTVCGSSYNEKVGEALGHAWDNWVVSSSEHTRTCQRDGSHVQAILHTFTTTNLCQECGFDCLTYKLVGGHYVVYSDNKVPKTVTTVIVSAQHCEVGDSNFYDVTQIADSAFMSNRNITRVELPATVTAISSYAFYNCASLTTVVLDDSSQLTDIGVSAFMNCTVLENLTLPNGLITIGGYAFMNCESLLEIDVPSSVQSLGSNAFQNTACYNDPARWTDNVLYLGKHLVKANARVAAQYSIKDGTISIGYQAFSECAGLEEISLPNSLLYVERDAFLGANALQSVAYAGTLDGWLAIIFVNDASSPLYNAARLNIEQASGDIVIPNGVTAIPAGTFRGTAITSVDIPDGVTFIGEEAFENCTQLAVINVPDSVKYIGANAFVGSGYYLDNSKWVDGVLYIGNHLIATKADELNGEYRVKDGTVTIGIEAFKDCVNLSKVSIVGTVVRIGANAFAGCTALTEIVFEDASYSWFANRLGSLSRLLHASDLSTPSIVPELMLFYNGEWKRWS